MSIAAVFRAAIRAAAGGGPLEMARDACADGPPQKSFVRSATRWPAVNITPGPQFWAPLQSQETISAENLRASTPRATGRMPCLPRTSPEHQRHGANWAASTSNWDAPTSIGHPENFDKQRLGHETSSFFCLFVVKVLYSMPGFRVEYISWDAATPNT